MSDLLLALDTLDVREQLTMQILPVGGELRPDLLDGESCLVISVSHFTPLATSTLGHREPSRSSGTGTILTRPASFSASATAIPLSTMYLPMMTLMPASIRALAPGRPRDAYLSGELELRAEPVSLLLPTSSSCADAGSGSDLSLRGDLGLLVSACDVESQRYLRRAHQEEGVGCKTRHRVAEGMHSGNLPGQMPGRGRKRSLERVADGSCLDLGVLGFFGEEVADACPRPLIGVVGTSARSGEAECSRLTGMTGMFVSWWLGVAR